MPTKRMPSVSARTFRSLALLLLPACGEARRDRVEMRNVSPAMEPTLKAGEIVTLERFRDTAAAVRAVAHDDLVLYALPQDSTKQFVKRLVGLPGDTLAMRRGRLLRNGREVAEPHAWFADSSASAQRHNWGPLVVPAGSYFVLGDNRDTSLDSRYWGYVPLRFLAGRVVDPGTGRARR